MLVQPQPPFHSKGTEGLTTRKVDDHEVLLSAREGDHDAGRRLVEIHGPSMARTAWSVLGRFGGNEADDVVQEAFIAALSTTSLPEGDVGAWLRAITARKALDWLRTAGRRKEQPLPEPHDDAARPQASGNAAAAEDLLALRALLSKLSPVDRAILLLADIEGHTMAEVARLVGLTRVAVKLRASRARRKLARMLKPVDQEKKS
jgi:RNA polymerase sigma-70 factor (ECF subfamily)